MKTASTWRVSAGIATAIALLGLSIHAQVPAPVPPPVSSPSAASAPSSCFAVDGLSPEDKDAADRLLLTMGDGEGLYTLAGGLKPISSGMMLSIRVAPDVDEKALSSLDQRRRVAARLTCGDVGIFTQVFASAQESKERGTLRVSELVLYHRSSVAATIKRHAAYFTALGITPASDPQEALSAVEHAPRADRWRGYGYLFGYPDDAVDFFVIAGADGDASGKVVPRDFRRIETFTKYGSSTSSEPPLSVFVYAVPKGAPESAVDKTIRETAAPIYARYVEARKTFVSADGKGAIALWRAWLGASKTP